MIIQGQDPSFMSHLKDHELITTDLSLSDLAIYSRDCFILEKICVARSLNAIKAFSPCHIPCLRRFLTGFYSDGFLIIFFFPFHGRLKWDCKEYFPVCTSVTCCHVQNCFLIKAWKAFDSWDIQEGVHFPVLILGELISLSRQPPLEIPSLPHSKTVAIASSRKGENAYTITVLFLSVSQLTMFCVRMHTC